MILRIAPMLRATEVLKKLRVQNDDQKTGVEIVRKAAQLAGTPDRDQRGRGRLRHRRQNPRKGSICLRLRRPERPVRQHALVGQSIRANHLVISDG